MENFYEKYDSITNKVKDQLSEFYDEASKIEKRIGEVDSVTLKIVLQNINKTCQNICINLDKIFSLNIEAINLSRKYLENLFEMVNDERNNVNHELEDIIETINNEPKFWDIIKFRYVLVKKRMKNVKDMDDMCDLAFETNNLLFLLNMKIIHLHIMQCCFPFSVNDYGKRKARKKQIHELFKYILGLCPLISEIISLADFISIIENAANIENYTDFRLKFYSKTDKNLKVLEQQWVMLNKIEEKQKVLITYFENCAEKETEKLESLKNPNAT